MEVLRIFRERASKILKPVSVGENENRCRPVTYVPLTNR